MKCRELEPHKQHSLIGKNGHIFQMNYLPLQTNAVNIYSKTMAIKIA